MLNSSLYDYSYKYIFVKETITVHDTSAVGVAANNTNQKVILKNCASFINCISKFLSMLLGTLSASLLGNRRKWNEQGWRRDWKSWLWKQKKFEKQQQQKN